jgi:hypothetical protein
MKLMMVRVQEHKGIVEISDEDVVENEQGND